jgi:predicted SnoaL-like aldol condensation-catalyzing enzyme
MMGGDRSQLPTFFDGDRFLQHNPVIADGVSGLGAAIQSGIWAAVVERCHRVVADGNFVFTQAEGTLRSEPTAFYDLFRVADGRLAEHWDVVFYPASDPPARQRAVLTGIGQPSERVAETRRPVDLALMLGPLRHGGVHDPATRLRSGGVWRATGTRMGAATLHLRSVKPRTVVARAWRPGAAAALEGVPELIGADDDPPSLAGVSPAGDPVGEAARRPADRAQRRGLGGTRPHDPRPEGHRRGGELRLPGDGERGGPARTRAGSAPHVA